uniref:Uncharacterized protein n=1 Tax=Panagrellus redivivus TaxID=6233 RepID=A0A7E4WCK2_PANRE
MHFLTAQSAAAGGNDFNIADSSVADGKYEVNTDFHPPDVIHSLIRGEALSKPTFTSDPRLQRPRTRLSIAFFMLKSASTSSAPTPEASPGPPFQSARRPTIACFDATSMAPRGGTRLSAFPFHYYTLYVIENCNHCSFSTPGGLSRCNHVVLESSPDVGTHGVITPDIRA